MSKINHKLLTARIFNKKFSLKIYNCKYTSTNDTVKAAKTLNINQNPE
jgi:hypothetical protein